MSITTLKVSSSFIPKGSKYPYRLVLAHMCYDLITRNILRVERDFNANGQFVPVPSGWELTNVNYADSLRISDDWAINIPKAIWDEIN